MSPARKNLTSPPGTTGAPTIVWFRRDLRLSDNPALASAITSGSPVIPLYIWAPREDGDWSPGAASRWWLHQSLRALSAELAAIGSKLILRKGPAHSTLGAIIRQCGARAVHWNRCYEPAAIARDRALKSQLRELGVEVQSFNAALLFEPWEVSTRSGTPYAVFTPFWRACTQMAAQSEPLPKPNRLTAPREWPCSLDLDELELEPRVDWASGLRAAWQVGEVAAENTLSRFVTNTLHDYDHTRDRPALVGTSRLSPFLHFGEISPRTIWHAIHRAADERQRRASRSASRSDKRSVISRRRTSDTEHVGTDQTAHVERFLAELGWREFAYHLLYHFPHTPNEPLREEFARFPWASDRSSLERWQRGQTGYPIVDAGMRQLWSTGWMHNRVRMIVASFLVKDLLIPWQDGARWFWDTLVDADLANNTLGWQWTAGCGADAAPYFRVFNPVLQGEKFDPDGEYVRRWIPELSKLPTTWIHKPWLATSEVLERAMFAIGKTYPEPIVDHAAARTRALAALAQAKSQRQ